MALSEAVIPRPAAVEALKKWDSGRAPMGMGLLFLPSFEGLGPGVTFPGTFF